MAGITVASNEFSRQNGANLSCACSTWGMELQLNVVDNSSSWYAIQRKASSVPAGPVVALQAGPLDSVVTLDGGLFHDAHRANFDFLLGHEPGDVLYFFRERAGLPQPSGAQCFGWDYGLHGSVAGLFLMGAGNSLRWANHSGLAAQDPRLEQLLSAVNQVVDGIAECQDPLDGYLMAFTRNATPTRENPDYVTSWVTHGLLSAWHGGLAANRTDAIPKMLRAHFDWFNSNEYLPEFLPPNGGPMSDTPPPGYDPVPPLNRTGYGAAGPSHLIYLIYQGMIAHTQMVVNGPVGTVGDVKLVQELIQEEWWLQQLVARNLSAIWKRHWFPHNYELTAFEAYFDMYLATGNETYLEAVRGAMEMFTAHWIHVGGSVAINEAMLYPPSSYYVDFTDRNHNLMGIKSHSVLGALPPSTGLFGHHKHHHDHAPIVDGDGAHAACAGPSMDAVRKDVAFASSMSALGASTGHPTGELCGSSFWIGLNQRFRFLEPANESYVAEMERSLYNVVIANQQPGVGIRYFAILTHQKAIADNHATCCEGQGTRQLGNIPGYVFTRLADGTVAVDMFTSATAVVGSAVVTMRTDFPYSNNVTIYVRELLPVAKADVSVSLSVRAPRWATADVTVLSSTGQKLASSGPATFLPAIDVSAGSQIEFTLPMGLRSTLYTGYDQASGRLKRYAVEYGPILLAAVGEINKDVGVVVVTLPPGADPLYPESWLVRDAAAGATAMVFRVVGAESNSPYFQAYHELDNEFFDVYAVLE